MPILTVSENVEIPVTARSSKSVCPSTSKFPSTFKFEFASITPFILTVSVNVEMPPTLKFVLIETWGALRFIFPTCAVI